MPRRPYNSDFMAFRVAAIYAVISLLWILFSDRIVNSIAVDRSTLNDLQTLKGWVFVLFSAGVIYIMVSKYVRRLKASNHASLQKEERHAILFRTAPMAIWEIDLSEARRLLDATIRSSIADPGIVFQTNPQLFAKFISAVRIRTLNQSAVDLIGAHTVDEAIAYSTHGLLAGTEPFLRDSLIRLYRGDTSAECECRLRTITGELRSALIRISVASGAEDPWELVVVCALDITERKRTEARLQERERMLSEAQRLGNLGAFEWDLMSNVLEWSDENHRLHGTDPRHFTPAWSKILDMIIADDRRRVEQYFEEQIAGRPPVGDNHTQAEYRIRRPDGQVRSLLTRAEIIRNSDGQAIQLMGVTSDITEHRQISDFLERYNARLQRLVTVIQQLSTNNDVDSLAQLVSNAAQLLVDADSAIFVLREDDQMHCIAENAPSPIFKDRRIPLSMGVSGWAVTHRQAVVIDDVRSDSRIALELYHNTPIASMIMAPIRSEDPIGAIGAYWAKPHRAAPDEVALLQALADTAAVALTNIRIYQDLDTARREALQSSQVNRQLYENAQREVAERKEAERRHQELEAQLRQSQKMEIIGILAGGIAHDFNNILTPLSGYADLALETLPPGAEGRDEIEHVLVAANRAKELIRQILTFSRRSDQVRKPIAISSVMKETVKLLRASLPPNIDIRFESGVTEFTVMADPSQLQQVIMNLCTNAYQAIGRAGGTLELTLDMARPEQVAGFASLRDLPCFQMQIRDSGAGIDPTVLSHIFEPFFTTKEKGEGTGLGLAVVQSIIAAHGGEITVESQVGVGTTFSIFLPLADVAPHVESPKVKRSPTGRGERILLVDDEVAIVTLLRKVLTRLGYDVIPFSDSVVALDGFRLSPHLFDLVIFDWNMPHVSGRQLAEGIRALRQDIPLLLMTGLRHEISSEELAALAINECIRKPFTPFEISTLVHNLLNAPTPSRIPEQASY